MSVSGVGGNNAWFTNWPASNRTPTTAASSASSSAAASLGQAISGGAAALSGVQSVTGASGQSMNSQDSSTFQQTMSSLASDLQSGNTTAAQGDYAQLQSLLKSSGVHGHGHHHHHHAAATGGSSSSATSSTDGTSASTDPFASAFASLGSSLQSGDLAGAQSAFSQLGSLLQDTANPLTQTPASSAGTALAGAIVDVTA